MLFGREKDLEDLQKVRDRLSDVERQLRMLQLEWADTLDRLKTMMFRAIKERSRAEQLKPDEPLPPNNLSDEDVASGQTSLPGLDPISERILARRMRIAGRATKEQ